MTNNFWKKLKRPFFTLAPMSDVTDIAFRQMFVKYGRPDVFYTEFVSADGLASAGKKNLVKHLRFRKNEKPIVAQIFGARPENIYTAARIVADLGFDGIDINMGCPQRKVEKQGAGAALIKKPELAREIIRAAKDGAGRIPVSIKTRIGYNEDTLDKWLPELLKEKPAAVAIHARTRKEMSDAPAHWDAIERAVKIARGSRTIIIGNGNVSSLAEARARAEETGADGIMIGRAAFGNPWIFSGRPLEEIALEEKLKALEEHSLLFHKLLKRIKNFNVIKKHFKAYIQGFPEAKKLRILLMAAKNAAEVSKIISKFSKKNIN